MLSTAVEFHGSEITCKRCGKLAGYIGFPFVHVCSDNRVLQAVAAKLGLKYEPAPVIDDVSIFGWVR